MIEEVSSTDTTPTDDKKTPVQTSDDLNVIAMSGLMFVSLMGYVVVKRRKFN